MSNDFYRYTVTYGEHDSVSDTEPTKEAVIDTCAQMMVFYEALGYPIRSYTFEVVCGICTGTGRVRENRNKPFTNCTACNDGTKGEVFVAQEFFTQAVATQRLIRDHAKTGKQPVIPAGHYLETKDAGWYGLQLEFWQCNV